MTNKKKIYKTLLTKLKIEQYEPSKNRGWTQVFQKSKEEAIVAIVKLSKLYSNNR